MSARFAPSAPSRRRATPYRTARATGFVLPVPDAARATPAWPGAPPGAFAALRALRGAEVVIKYGGAVLSDAGLADSWARDVARLRGAGVRAVVVHGGGPALTRVLSRLGIECSFDDGHRVTTAEAAEVAEMVLSGRINKEVVARLVRAGVPALGLSGTDAALIRVRRHRPGGRDIGFVGEVEALDPAPLRLLLDHGFVPVISSTAAGADGRPYYINADLVAGAAAGALRARALVFLSDVPGVLRDGAVVPRLAASGARCALDDGTAAGGMRPKLRAALDALARGVPAVHLADGREPGALLRALLSPGGSGTAVVPDAEGRP
jgi:acetylglutamate kinase